MLSTEMLSRVQFAFTISFHILFPAFSIGLALFLAIMEGLWIKTNNILYLTICKFWNKIFALTFGMGIISGIVMEFQLGTNWSGFTSRIGSVLGPLFTYEVMTAFFIEAGFLGVMLLGWDKVSKKLHYTATLLVVIGTTLSAYWIMSANSWMQHPVGYTIKNGVFIVTNWYEIVFNPATMPRFIHMMLASYISTGFVIISVAAYYILKNQHLEFAKKCLKFVWIALFILIPLQIYMGDENGVSVYKNQPIKTAAIEGLWETKNGAPLLLFAIPNQKQQKMDFSIGIPHLASLINTHNWNGKLVGLKSVSPNDQPEIWLVFYCFRIMAGIGFLMLFLAITAFYLMLKKKLFTSNLFLKISVISSPLGFIALITGWLTTEVGRQPWIVYNLIRTSEAVSSVNPIDVIISLILIIIVYGIIFGYFYTYYFHKTIKKGPNKLEKMLHQPFRYMAPLDDEKLK